jgi:hypothetical protein
MIKILQLPLEILLFIRSFLFPLSFLRADGEDEMDVFFQRESEWSWRNFLSTSNHSDWKLIKKQTMVWSLNQFAARRYFVEENFRSYISERAYYPNQVQCRFFNLYEKPSELHVFINSVMGTSNLGVLCLQCYSKPSMVSCSTLHTLSLQICESLESLGKYENLRVLKLVRCPSLKTIGQVEQLTELSLEGVPTEFVNSLSVERVAKISRIHVTQFQRISPKLKFLTELSLYTLSSDTSWTLDSLPFPSLISLSVENFIQINLIGLINLKHLDVNDTPSDQIIGKKEIYPQLLSLVGCGEAFLLEDMRKYKNLKKFRYFDIPAAAREKARYYELNIAEVDLDMASDFTFPSYQVGGNKVKNLAVRSDSVCGLDNPGISFHKIKFVYEKFSKLSVFQNVQNVILINCFSIKDIRPLRRVPYLTLDRCENIGDFSCLGLDQHYLHISYGTNLTDEAVERFGNIAYLRLTYCFHITILRQLTNNRFIYIQECRKLTWASFQGRQYVKIYFCFCNLLKDIVIDGKVYVLKVLACHRVNTNDIQNVEIFDV